MNSPSGVNASGPLISRTTSISSSPGTRRTAFSSSGSKRGQSSSSSRLLKSERDAVERPRRGIALVAAHDEPARLRPEVDEERRVAHRRHVERQAGRAGDEVLVRHRHDRDVHACERAELLREDPARVDDDVRLDLALVGGDARDAAALDVDRGHAGVRLDLGAALPRTRGEGERELRGVDIAVGGEIRGAENALGGHRREELLRFGGGDQLERQAEGLRPAGLPRDLLHPLRRRREPKRSDLAPAGLEPDLVADRAIEVDARHHHLRQRERAAQLADEPCGVKRRARRQVGALDEDHVVPAEPREPVEDRAAADAAADHHRSRPGSHRTENLTGSREPFGGGARKVS